MLAGVVASFLEAYPDIQFTIDSRNHETIVEQAVCRAVDCGFLKLPVSHPSLSVEPIITSGTVCVIKKGHALDGLDVITPKELNNVPLILLGKGRNFQRVIEQAFRDVGARMNIRAETHAIGASCALAAQGVGVAIVNELMAKAYRGSGVRLVRFEPNVQHQYAFVSSTQIPMSRAARAFLAHCKSHFHGQ